MSFYELYGLAEEKHKPVRQGAATCSAEPHSIPSSDFVELLWENGQVVMQGQSTSNDITSETAMKDLHRSISTKLDEHDDMLPCLRHPMNGDETVQHNYGPDFYTQLSGVTAHNLSNHTNGLQTVPSFEQLNGVPIRPKESQFEPLSIHQSVCSFPSFRSKSSVVDSAQKICSLSAYPRMKTQTQDVGQKFPSSTIMNFSHFAKHTIVKSSLDTSSTKAGPEVSTKQADPLHVASISGQHIESEYLTQIGNHSGLVRNIDMPTHKNVASGKPVTENNEKNVEPNVASSVCSGNSVERASNDPAFGLKRKYHEFEDSEYCSEDIEEDSVGIRKAASNRVGSGSKRSRAAEVHNLSERRRRDRINEKMRALQELIPNCNKVDKASMLDEAIEYLKTLQLQVQMMTMGPGLCMPQMVLPHAAQMRQFSPMSVGMGYGLGMMDMNVNPSNYQLVQMPSRFPMAPATGLCNLNANSLPNIPMYGFQGQGVGTPVTSPLATSYTADHLIRPIMDNP